MAALLAFDTATEALALALQTRAGALWCHNGAGGAQASAGLLPQIRQALADHRQALAALDAIAFGRGPGAFTGLRTACAVAQGLAFGAGLPVLPVCSLLIVAEDARAAGTAQGAADLAVAMDARMGEWYAARYRWQAAADGAGGDWLEVMAPGLHAPAALAERWHADPPDAVAGNGVALWPAGLPRPPHWQADTTDRAAALMRLAQRQWLHGPCLCADAALPVYLRDKVAQTVQERAQARQAP